MGVGSFYAYAPSFPPSHPRDLHALGRERAQETAEDELYPFDWAGLVPQVVNPVRVSIIEAMRWFGEPLSAKDLSEFLDEGLSYLAYHVRALDDLKVIEAVSHRQVRGARQTFYFFRAAS